jgi:hypothetical protein
VLPGSFATFPPFLPTIQNFREFYIPNCAFYVSYDNRMALCRHLIEHILIKLEILFKILLGVRWRIYNFTPVFSPPKLMHGVRHSYKRLNLFTG